MRRDIYGLLKNAMDRGQSLDDAIKSLVTAGYKESEVRETVVSSNLGNLGMPNSQTQQTSEKSSIQAKKDTLPQTPPQQAQPQQNQPQMQQPIPMQQMVYQQPQKSGSGTAIFLVVVLILLVVVFVVSLVFKDQIINFIKGLSG